MTTMGRSTFTKRLAAVITALAMLILSMPAVDLTAFAEEVPWEGSGTETDPWRISTPAELVAMTTGVGNPMAGSVYSARYFALLNDIDMSGVSFTPIGTEKAPFAGIFYGCGYTIKNLTINTPAANNVGLFGAIKYAAIKDLNVSGNITGHNNVGAIVGVDLEASFIKDCSFSGTIEAYSHAGGIAGICGESSRIFGCTNSGTVTATYDLSGGIAGNAEKGSCISYCCNKGTVTGKIGFGGICGSSLGEITYCYNDKDALIKPYTSKSDTFGGIAGYFLSESGKGIHHCFNLGTVGNKESDNYHAGGIVGQLCSKIEWCYNKGSIYGQSSIGGIAGDAFSSDSAISCCYNTGAVNAGGNDAGGLFGSIEVFKVDQCYNTGTVTSSGQKVGGIAGYTYETATVSNCYNKGTIKGDNFVGGIIGQNEKSAATISCCYNYTDPNPAAAAENGADGKIVGMFEADNGAPALQNNYYTNITKMFGINIYIHKAVGWMPLSATKNSPVAGCNYLEPESMNDPSKFAGWDFTNIWKTGDGSDVPGLDPSLTLQFKGGTFYYGDYVPDPPQKFPLPEGRYEISVSSEALDFGSIDYGESAPEAMTLTVTNTGTRKLFAANLSANKYEISAPSSEVIPIGGSVTYSVRPLGNLKAGNYNTSLTVSASNGSSVASKQVQLRFTVNELPVEAPWEGSGTEEDPWLIKTVDELFYINSLINKNGIGDPSGNRSYIGKYFKLVNDIDARQTRLYTPIGTEALHFCGNFDGAGHIIYNLDMLFDISNEYSGLFGFVENGCIKDLCVAGYMDAPRSDGAYAGGVAGFLFNSRMENCAFVGNIDGKGIMGGLVGYNIGSVIRNCFHIGKIKGGLTNYSGGLIGFITTPGSGTRVINSYHFGELSGLDSKCAAGSIAGDITSIQNPGYVFSDVYASGTDLKAFYRSFYSDKTDIPGAAETIPEDELRDLENREGISWDFENTWVSTDDLPMLREFTYKTTYVYGTNSKTAPGKTESDIAFRLDTTTARENEPADGYTFDGWNTKKNGTGERYESGDKLPAKDIILYAQYAKKAPSFTVSPETADLGKQGYGYTAFDTAEVTVSNLGVLEESFTASVSENLEFVGSSAASVSGGRTAEFTVKPKAGLSAGKYTETVTVICPRDPDNAKSVTVTFEVGKTEHKVTAPKALTLYCNGKPQVLVKAGKCSTGTILYSLSKNGTYSKELPEATEGGEYTVWYYVKATDNYNASAKKSVKVTITDDRLMGDVDGNKEVDVLDLTITARYLARWTGYEEDKYDFTVCDFDGNGKTDVADYAILARSLARWNGYRETYLLSVKEYRSKA